MKKISLLFVSSYLSHTNGTICVSEKIAYDLEKSDFRIELVSRKRNKFLRLLDICLKILFSESKVVLIDVYSGPAFMISEFASFFASVFNKKQIFTLHGGGLPQFYPQNYKRIKRTFERAEVITTPSTMLKSFFELHGYSIKLIPNSIELEKFPYKRSKILSHSILWVRSFDTIYNPELAVEALAKILVRYPDAKLTMVGPDKGRLDYTKEVAQKLKVLDKIEFVGPVSNDELFTYFQNHEVYINTTMLESFGVALIEAASCGIPIVSTNVGEIPHMWIDKEEMLMVPSMDSQFMADCVCELFKDKMLARTISMKARKKVESYNWERIKPLWLDLIKTVNER
jgi:glycosyltransferase involved in cell wall biosynthesis